MVNDADIVNAVTAKLAGEFYVGQRVRLRPPYRVNSEDFWIGIVDSVPSERDLMLYEEGRPDAVARYTAALFEPVPA